MEYNLTKEKIFEAIEKTVKNETFAKYKETRTGAIMGTFQSLLEMATDMSKEEREALNEKIFNYIKNGVEK